MATLCGQSGRVERRELVWPGIGNIQAYLVDNRVGESPVWDSRRGCLWWIDVRSQQVLRLQPHDDHVTRWTFESPLGALALATEGRLAVAMRHEVVLFVPESGQRERLAVVEDGLPGNRLNDGKVSPSGRWWVIGSMDDAPQDKRSTGSLYRLGADGSVATLHRGLTVTNGIAWNRAGTVLYFSDSHAGCIWQAPWNETTGTMGPPEPMASADEAAGRPDGAFVDGQDNYWSAGVSAGCLNRIAGGRIQARIELPCRAPTMGCFGGHALGDLYVTSLVRPQWASTNKRIDGSLLRIPAPAHSVPAATWALPS